MKSFFQKESANSAEYIRGEIDSGEYQKRLEDNKRFVTDILTKVHNRRDQYDRISRKRKKDFDAVATYVIVEAKHGASKKKSKK